METALSPAPPAARADFADWLSPMLVKELRQGVRTRAFVSIFILLQVAMLLDLSLSLLVAANGGDASEGSTVFWVMVALPVLMIVPLSGLNAISGEVRGNTLELIFLTRLTAFRIVLGKWFALFSQSLLLVCAVLPYLVLRYFMGGVDLASELVLLGTMLVGSALLTALATGFSAFPARLVRPLVGVGSVLTVLFGLQYVSFFLFRGGGTPGLPGPAAILATLVCSAVLLALMLDAGAARIAPPAENHPAVLRTLACVGLLTAGVTQAVSRSLAGVSLVTFVVAVLVCGVAVCEQPRAIPSLYRPFARWGFPGRVAGRLFYPGWHTGTLFTLAMFAAFGALFAREKVFDHGEWSERFVALLGTLLLPVALARTILRRWNRPTALFFIVQGFSSLVLIFAAVCDNTLDTSLKSLVGILPLCALMVPPADLPGWDGAWWKFPALWTTGVSVLAALAASVAAFRQTALLERESLTLPTPPRNPPPPTLPSAPPHATLA